MEGATIFNSSTQNSQMFQEVDLTRITAQVSGVHRQTLAYKRQVFSQNIHVRGTKERGCLEFELELNKIVKTCLLGSAFFFIRILSYFFFYIYFIVQ